MRTGPNWGSVAMPTITSSPCGAMVWTLTPSITASGYAARHAAMMASQASATCCSSASATFTPPASLLCVMSGEDTFSTQG